MDLCPPNLTASQYEHEGKRLLNLLKTLERHQKDDDQHCHGTAIESEHSNTLEILYQMAAVYQQRGLFTDEESKAKYISNAPVTLAKKRKRGGGGGAGAGASGTLGKISSVLASDGQNTSEEAYALSNLCRILIPNSEKEVNYSSSIVEASANAVSALCQYCIQNSAVKCAVEKEMIGSIASQLLTGLGKVLRYLLEGTDVDEAIIACCNCAKNVMIVSNLKLSRSTNAILSIQSVATDILFRNSGEGSVYISGTCRAASNLLASIPLVGNSDNVPPLQIWSDNVLITARKLEHTLTSFLPLVKKLEKGKSQSSVDGSQWIENVKSTIISQADRLMVFLLRIKGYVSLLIAFLEMDGYHMSNTGSGALIPISSLLQVSEQMLLFPSVAETRFLATNSKLRDISVEGGLLSPSAAVMVGNAVKYLGFSLVQNICSKLTTSALPYGGHLLAIVLKHLQSSSSLTLKRLLDPSSSADRNSMKKLLHASILLRMKSVQIYTLIVQKVGSNAAFAQNDTLPKAIAFIAGNILEQMSSDNERNENMEYQHWGTEDEKAELVATCCDALRISLLVFGGFLSLPSRTLIDSITSTCLSKLTKSHDKFCNFSLVKAAILNLGTCAIATPWPDGASSGLVSELQKIAFSLKFDCNVNVSTAAYNAISICNMAVTPRAPPLVIVSRTNVDDATKVVSQSRFFSKEALESGMDVVNEDIIKAKLIEKDVDERKRKDRRSKKESNILKNTLKAETLDTVVVKESKSSIKGTFQKDEEILVLEQMEEESVHEATPKKIVSKNDSIHQTLQHDKNSDDAKEKVSEAMDPSTKKERETKENEIQRHDNDVEKAASFSSDDEHNDDGSDDDFPPIIDCDPDDDDV